MTINDIIAELKLFSDKILELNSPAPVTDVDNFEKKFNLKLPQDYKDLMSNFNGFSLMGTTVYGLGKNYGANSLEENFNFEHNEVNNPMYAHLIPFSPDGYGNHYCFDTKTINSTSCDIVFWQHDYSYDSEDMPEVSNKSFLEWIKEVVIDWTLENYDYEGNKK